MHHPRLAKLYRRRLRLQEPRCFSRQAASDALITQASEQRVRDMEKDRLHQKFAADGATGQAEVRSQIAIKIDGHVTVAEFAMLQTELCSLRSRITDLETPYLYACRAVSAGDRRSLKQITVTIASLRPMKGRLVGLD